MQVPAEAASAGDDNHDTDPTEHLSTASGGMHESEESADEPELLPDSWETMAEEAAGHEPAQESAGMAHTRTGDICSCCQSIAWCKFIVWA